MAKFTPKTPKEQVEEYLNDTEEARHMAQKCRDYYDGKQWTAEEVEKLRQRRQAPIVVNRIQPKIDGMIGLYEIQRTDPKALPRTKKHEEAAQAATDALRYVVDNTKFQRSTRLDVAEDFFVEGIGAVLVDARRKKDDVEIQIKQIPWDRFYYDPHSRQRDFKDARFMGIWLWMDLDDVPITFPGAKVKWEELEEGTAFTDETTEDRPRWRMNTGTGTKRIRIAQHFFREKGVWKMTVFCGDVVIIKPKESPFIDEDGLPMNPIEAVSAKVDRNNERYGEVKGLISQQDELNHRRSKFLHMNSTRQTYGNDAAIQDVPAAKSELQKPDGHLKINGDAQFGKDFGILTTNDMSQAQFMLYQDAKQEMDRNGFSAPLGGNVNDRDLSGKAIDKLQQGSAMELKRMYAALSDWEIRVYTQIWDRVKQFWKEEKWLRITDDQDVLQWVGFNTQITVQKYLAKIIEDKSVPLKERQQNEQILQFLMQTQNPKLQEVVDIQNNIAETDVDITFTQSFDTANIQQEQFALLAQFSQSSQDVDIIDLLEISELRNKKDLIEKIQRRRSESQQMQMMQMQEQKAKQDRAIQFMEAEKISEIGNRDAKTQNINADTIRKGVETITAQIENVALARNPDPKPQIAV